MVNLLETVLYHPDLCQALGDTIFDLIDYCYRKMTHQFQVYAEENNKISNAITNEESDKNVNEAMRVIIHKNNSNKKIFFITIKNSRNCWSKAKKCSLIYQ